MANISSFIRSKLYNNHVSSPFTSAISLLTTPPNELQLTSLSVPSAIINYQIPVVLDSGKTQFFEAFRVQHHTHNAPFLGLLQLDPHGGISQTTNLAFQTTLKTSLFNLKFGGSHTCIAANPAKLSTAESERLIRNFANVTSLHVGTNTDITTFGPNCPPASMRWCSEEYQSQLKLNTVKIKKGPQLATFTGKPSEFFGTKVFPIAHGLGNLIALNTILRLTRLERSSSSPLTVTIHGFGKVGQYLAGSLSRQGFLVTTVSDSSGVLHDSRGLDIANIISHKKTRGHLANIPIFHTLHVPLSDLFSFPTNIFISASPDYLLTSQTAINFRPNIYLEVSSQTLSPEIDKFLNHAGVMIIPNLLAGAGSLLLAKKEWQANMVGRKPTQKSILDFLDTQITKIVTSAFRLSKSKKVSLRTAAVAQALAKLIY
jgi:glutamate dehydrogenase/leucine dehydrogenase